MKFLTTSLALALTSALTACTPSGVSQQDKDWLAAAHQGNQAEIKVNQFSLANTGNQAINSLNRMMIDDHTALDKDVVKLAGDLHISLPKDPTDAQKDAYTQLSTKSGKQFDYLFLDQQIKAHQETLTATNKEISQGHDVGVVNLAKKTSPVVQKHLAELTAIQNSKP